MFRENKCRTNGVLWGPHPLPDGKDTKSFSPLYEKQMLTLTAPTKSLPSIIESPGRNQKISPAVIPKRNVAVSSFGGVGAKPTLEHRIRVSKPTSRAIAIWNRHRGCEPRRGFLATLGSVAAWPLAARPQQPNWLPPRRSNATVGRTVTLAKCAE
jgi:hypothetical protein